MAKRNARKQATREEIEGSDPVCRKLANLADEADLLILTQGADYDTDNELAAEYDKRLAYLPVLLDELNDHRVRLVLTEDLKPDTDTDEDPSTLPAQAGPSAHEGSPDGNTDETSDDTDPEHE